jgi:hypothetical protein
MRIWLLAVIVAFCWPAASFGNSTQTSASTSDGWNATTRASILSHAQEALGSYFFENKISSLRAAIDANRNVLVGITDPDKFAAALTQVLYAVAHDKHIFVDYSAEPVPQAAIPSAAEVAYEKQAAAYDDYSYDVSARLHGNIGYLWIDGFDPLSWSKGMLDAAMALLAHTDALIVDLRGNGGGRPDAVDYLLGYFFDKPTEVTGFIWRKNGKTSIQHEFAAGVVGGPRYIHKPVYLLIDDQTFSGGEQFAYDMKTLHRAELVGKTTAGGANPGGTVPLSDHFAIFIPSGTARNPYTGTNWEGVGVSPDIDSSSKGALLIAYVRALKAATNSLDASAQVRARALKDPASALAASMPNR